MKKKQLLTDAFEIGYRVKVNVPNHMTDGMTGTVVDLDAYTVEVRLDIITPGMAQYEDGRKGLLNYKPQDLIILPTTKG